MKFKKNEWVLSFSGGRYNASVYLARIAENVYEYQKECLILYGSFTSRASTEYLHKMPTSMKKLIPKDPDGKILSVI